MRKVASRQVFNQGHQIGRIFAYWAIIFFEEFFLIAEVSNFLATFSTDKAM
jgi:hypothetical protein